MSAGAGHTGTGDFGKTVDVVGNNAGFILDFRTHLVGPRFGAENAVFESGVAPEVEPLLFGDVHNAKEVARGAGDDRNAEILHQHELLFGVAAADGQYRAAELFAAVVKSESAGEKSVAVGDLQNVFVGNAVHRQTPRSRFRPDFDIALGVGQAYGFAGRARRAVEAHDLFHRRGGKPERIFVAQVGLHHERKLGDIFQGDDVAGLHAFFIAAATEKGNALVFVGGEFLKLCQLHRPQFVYGHEIRGGDRVHCDGFGK